MAIILDFFTFVLLAILFFVMAKYILKSEKDKSDIFTSEMARKILDEEKRK